MSSSVAPFMLTVRLVVTVSGSKSSSSSSADRRFLLEGGGHVTFCKTLILLDSSLIVKAAPHECVIRTGLP